MPLSGNPVNFSERMARNMQTILKEESYFDKVADPAAGSYYIESLTDSLVENAWELFLKIDEQGGYVKAFVSGFIGSEIKSHCANSAGQMVATRREILLGTNQYPNVQETMKDDVVEDIAFPDPEHGRRNHCRTALSWAVLRRNSKSCGLPPKIAKGNGRRYLC